MPKKKIVSTNKVPPPYAHYSNAVVAGGFVFVAGQTGVDPNTKRVSKSVAEQTRQAIANVKAILEAAGSSLDNVVTANVYLKDANDFWEMDTVYRTFFPYTPPARTAVQAPLADKRCVIEINAIALKS